MRYDKCFSYLITRHHELTGQNVSQIISGIRRLGGTEIIDSAEKP
jgi:hypothetical protein